MESRYKLYTTQEAAVLLGFTDGRLRQMILRGEATPAQKVGGTWVFTIEEIERLQTRPKAGRPKKQKEVVNDD